MKIAKEATRYVLLSLIVAIAVAWWLHPLAAILPLAFAVFTLWFFRDPSRQSPNDPDALLSPADGKIIQAGPETISVFMNVFNVHVCRAPTAGEVIAAEHHPGRFMAAFHDDAAIHNERTVITLQRGGRRITFTLIAGLIARRIVCRVDPGQRLEAGQRVGLIQFGSRVDLQLPRGSRAVVEIGQRVVAGETVLARYSD